MRSFHIHTGSTHWNSYSHSATHRAVSHWKQERCYFWDWLQLSVTRPGAHQEFQIWMPTTGVPPHTSWQAIFQDFIIITLRFYFARKMKGCGLAIKIGKDYLPYVAVDLTSLMHHHCHSSEHSGSMWLQLAKVLCLVFCHIIVYFIKRPKLPSHRTWVLPGDQRAWWASADHEVDFRQPDLADWFLHPPPRIQLLGFCHTHTRMHTNNETCLTWVQQCYIL